MLKYNPLKIPLYWQTLIGMLLGILVGVCFGEKAEVLGVVSKLIVEAIKWVAMPLLFFAIVEAISGAKIRGQALLALIFVAGVNGFFAIVIGLLVSNGFKPGLSMPLSGVTGKLTESSILLGFTSAMSNNPKASIFTGTTLVILVAILAGFFLLALRAKKVDRWVKKILGWNFNLIEFVALFIPLAVFCSVSKVIGTHGFSLVKGLTVYFVSCLLGMALHVGIVYQTWIRMVCKIPLKEFWKAAKEPVIYAFGINSSLATLPITLKTLSNLKVSDGSARLGACIGTNFNNDGILLYEVFASLFLAQAYGVHLGIEQQLLLCVICIIATIGVAGVPEAGMISLALVASAIGLPIESLPLLLTVDWVLGRVRSVINVLGDMTVSIGIDQVTGLSRRQ